MADDTDLDILECKGRATAAICIQTAIVGKLVERNLLSIEDAAMVSALADSILDASPTPEDEKLIAKAAIRGFAASVTRRLTRN